MGKWLIFTILLAGALLYFALRGVDWHDLWTTVREARLPLVALALGLLNLSFFLRALRWRVLLSARARVTRTVVFGAMALGYLGNSLLPARAGDIIRSAMIKRRTVISFSYALATTLTERIMDVAVLVLIGLLTVASFQGVAPWIIHTTWIMAALGSLGILALFALPRMEAAFARMLVRSPLAKFAHTGLEKVAREFLLGMRSLQEPTPALAYGGITIAVWLIDALAVVTVASSLNLSLSLADGLFFLAALGLSSAAPSTPGYVGIYQFVAVTVLMPMGFTRSQALAHIFLFQGVLYCMILFWGAVFSWRGAGDWLRSARQQTDLLEVS